MALVLFLLGPLSPIAFNLTSRFHGILETTFTLDWDLPSWNGGPAAIIDHYIIYISPIPLLHSARNFVPSPPWNVTLAHNTPYTINITAVNCAGESNMTGLNGPVFVGK